MESETEEELILSEDESDAELDDNIPSTSSNKTGVIEIPIGDCFRVFQEIYIASYVCCFFSHKDKILRKYP